MDQPDASSTTTEPGAARPRWRRAVTGRNVVLAVSAGALLLSVQGFAQRPPRAEAPADDRDGLVATTEVVATEIADGFGGDPVVPPALPETEAVEVPAPADRTQVDPAADRTPSPQGTVTDEPLEDATPLDLAPVETKQPRIKLEQVDQALQTVLDQVGGGPDDVVADALAVEGVTFATAVDVAEMPITSEKGVEPIRIAAVDPSGFRVLTPQVTADADGVWQRIDEGDAAFTHDIGTRLELELGSRVPAGDGEGATLRVGAYASNGVPPIADVVVSRSTAKALGLTGTRTLLISIAEGADAEAIAAQLAEVTGMQPEIIEEPETRRAFLTGEAARDAFEPFSYVSLGDGMIQIERDWVQRNIVSADVPIFRGKVTCHRHLIPQLRGALEDVVEAGLADEIDPSQYGGCWVPRHILFNPGRPISMHAWGLAIDFNVRGNEYGNRNPQMHPGIVEIFERWGFVWGGRWSTPDGMHFELGALLQEGERG